MVKMAVLIFYVATLLLSTCYSSDATVDNEIACPNCTQIRSSLNVNNNSIVRKLEENMFNEEVIHCDPNTHDELVHNSVTMETFIVFQKETIRQTILWSEDRDSQIINYEEFLSSKKSEHEELTRKLHDLASKNDVIIKQMNDEFQRLKDINIMFDELRRKVKEKLPKVYNATDDKAALDALYEVDFSLAGLQKFMTCCQQQFPDAEVIASSEKLLMDSNVALLFGNSEMEYMPKFYNFSHPGNVIKDKIDRLTGYGSLTLKRLQELRKTAKDIFDGGLVYAAIRSDKKGNVRSAKISIKDKVYLHHLQDLEPPANAYTIKQSQLLKLLNKNSTEVFMDLAWEGSTRGRVHILLSSDSSYVRQFRMLCTGDLGQSYAHSNFSSVGGKNTSEEYVTAGNYDGKGGSAILKGLRKDDLIKVPDTAGLVWINVDSGKEHKHSATFGMTTGRGLPNVVLGMIGQIQEGLDVVKEAVHVTDVTQVEIINCGVVLPL